MNLTSRALKGRELASSISGYLRPLRAELMMPRFYILTGLAALCIFISTVVEDRVRLSFILSTAEEKLTRLDAAWYVNASVWSSFLREVGFAFLIALAITILVERTARAEQLHATESMLANVSDNVLNAVLRIKTPDSIVRQVMGSVFSSSIVRHDLRLTMTVSRMPAAFEQWRDRCVELRINSSYELENVSGNQIECEVRLFVPIPSFSELKDLATVENVSMGTTQLSADKIEEGGAAISDTDYEKRYLWSAPIGPRERLRVATNYKLVKELSDNELWTSLYPTTSIEVAVDMRLEDHIWNVDALHSGILKALDAPPVAPYSARRIVFRSEEAVLPYQGIMLWWRPNREPQETETVIAGEDAAASRTSS